MKIGNVLKVFREAQMFEYLASLSQVDSADVKICQTLVDVLTRRSRTGIAQLSQMTDVATDQVRRVIRDLLHRQLLVQQDQQVKFKHQMVTNRSRSAPKSSAVPVVTREPVASVRPQPSVKSSSVSRSSSNDWAVSELSQRSSSSASLESSPLNSYFASVNAALNDNYLRSDSSAVQSSRRDHFIKRNHLNWLASSSASSSAERAAKSSAQGDQLRFGSLSSQSSSASVSTKRPLVPSRLANRHANRQHHRFKAVARSLFQKVSFISLMSHAAKVRQLAKAQFKLVVAARKYEGIKQADGLFKYEFKMNYQKFGKIGNRINNLLMKSVSKHNR